MIGDGGNKKGLEAQVRPGSLDVVGQQVELFPFDAFNFEFDPTESRYIISLKDPWQFYFADPEGYLGGWQIASTELKAVADLDGDGINDDVLLSLNAEKRRIEVYDNSQPTQVLKMAFGYLDGIESYTSTDYGLYLNDPNVAVIDGGGESRNGDWLIKHDAAYVILNDSGDEIGRFGSLGSGEVGLTIGPTGSEFFYADEDGLTLTGAITATSGELQTLLISGELTIATGGQITAGTVTIDDTGVSGTGFVLGASGLAITGGTINIGGGTFSVDASGNLTATNVDLTGEITANTGAIGSWLLDSGSLRDTNNQIVLNPVDIRTEIWDPTGTTLKAAFGYLGGIGAYTTSNYGLYVAAGTTTRMEGGGEFVDNDYFIQEDGAFVIMDDSVVPVERGRFGSLGGGLVGLKIGDIDPDAGTGDGIYVDETGKAVFSGDLTVGTMPILSDSDLAAHWSFDDAGPGVDPDDIAAYWKFDGDVLDSSGNGNDGTMSGFGPIAEYHFEDNVLDETGNHNATSYGTPTYGTGVSGKAINYDASGDYIIYGNTGDIINDDSFSVSTWLMAGSTTGFKFLIVDSLNIDNFSIYTRGTPGADLSCRYTSNAGTRYALYGGTLDYTKNNHIVVTYSNGVMKAYVNNVLFLDSVSEAARTQDRTTLRSGYVGSTNVAFQQDDTRFYDYALSDAERTALYTRPQEPSHWVDGVSGKALAFNGKSSYVTLPNIPITADISFSFWTNNETTEVTPDYFFDSNLFSERFILSKYYNFARFSLYIDSTWHHFASTSFPSSANLEYVVITITGTSASIYIGGEFKETITITAITPFTPTEQTIGARYSGSNPMGGFADDFRILHRHLTAAEIGYLHKNPGADFNSWTATIADNSGHGLTATNHGASFVPGISGNALAFDGVDDYVEMPVTLGKNFTITFWASGITEETFTTRHDLFSGNISPGNNGRLLCYTTTTHLIFLWTVGGLSYARSVLKADAIGDHFFSVSFSDSDYDGQIRVYIDAVYSGIASVPATQTGINTVLIMGANSAKSYLFNGTIDETRVYYSNLTADEVKYLYWNPAGGGNRTSISGDQITTGAIKSTDYVAGVSGWNIDLNGSAAFNDVSIKNVPSNIENNLTVTVGVGGDFTTIDEALEYLTGFVSLYKNGGFSAEVQLLSGFVITKPLTVKSINLGWIKITSVDAKVDIDMQSVRNEGKTRVFAGYTMAVLPYIDCLFVMTNSPPTAAMTVFYLEGGSRLSFGYDCGVEGDSSFAANNGLMAMNGAYVNAYRGIFTGFNNGVYAEGVSNILFQSGSANNCSEYGIVALRASTISAGYASATNCKYGIAAEDGARVEAIASDCSSASSFGYFVDRGGILIATAGNGTLSQTRNEVAYDGKGIIFAYP